MSLSPERHGVMSPSQWHRQHSKKISLICSCSRNMLNLLPNLFSKILSSLVKSNMSKVTSRSPDLSVCLEADELN